MSQTTIHSLSQLIERVKKLEEQYASQSKTLENLAKIDGRNSVFSLGQHVIRPMFTFEKILFVIAATGVGLLSYLPVYFFALFVFSLYLFAPELQFLFDGMVVKSFELSVVESRLRRKLHAAYMPFSLASGPFYDVLQEVRQMRLNALTTLEAIDAQHVKVIAMLQQTINAMEFLIVEIEDYLHKKGLQYMNAKTKISLFTSSTMHDVDVILE